MNRILCLWLPNWPIQRLIRSRPELKNQPVVLAVQGSRGGVVVACSSEAVAQGIHPDMPVAEAQALVPDVFIAPQDQVDDRRALEKLAEACEQFSPCVALEEGDEPESLLLDITNLEHLHGSEERLAARVRSFFMRRGYRVRIAVAGTVGMAWALAHFAIADCELQIVDYSHQSETRDPKSAINLPVESLRISPEIASLLRDLGIEAVAQLQLLPREDLAQRFGEELLLRLDQFTGDAVEAIEPHRAVAELQASYSLEEPTADRAVLMYVFGQMLDDMCRRLVARDQGAVVLVCGLLSPEKSGVGSGVPVAEATSPSKDSGLRTANCGLKSTSPQVLFRIGLVQPSADPQQLLELVEVHLETLRLSEEVDRVQIHAAVVGRLGERQGELFNDRWPSDSHQLAVLLNRLSSRLGSEQVLRAELGKSPVPERAVRWKAATSHQGSRKLQNANCKLQNANWRGRRKIAPSAMNDLQFAICNLHSPRPLLLHSQPRAIDVVCVAPDGPPRFVWLEKRRERIVHHVGPERIETLWWRGPTIRRDYYRIATESGNHLWIFRRLRDARWFVHGMFG